MKWLLTAVAVIVVSFTAAANPPGVDESVHELVMNYIHLPCEALEYSYQWMFRDIKLLTNVYQTCISKQDTSESPVIKDDPWYGLQCVYILQHWQTRYDHIKSVEKAWHLMCDDNGRKEEQHEIDF